MANAKPFPWRSLHRIVSALAVVLTLYLGVTGSLIELIDFRTIITAPSPFDPNLRAIREDFAGPGGYEVLGAEDYLAQSLPGKADLPALAKTSLKAARTALGDAPLSYFELRMAHGRPRCNRASVCCASTPPRGNRLARLRRAGAMTIAARPNPSATPSSICTA